MQISNSKPHPVRSPLGRTVLHVNNGAETLILNDSSHVMAKYAGAAQKQLILELLASGFDEHDDAVLTKFINFYWSQAGAS